MPAVKARARHQGYGSSTASLAVDLQVGAILAGMPQPTNLSVTLDSPLLLF